MYEYWYLYCQKSYDIYTYLGLILYSMLILSIDFLDFLAWYWNTFTERHISTNTAYFWETSEESFLR